MAAKKKGPGKGRGPSSRPASPAKRTTVPKPAAAKPPAAGTPSGAPRPAGSTPKPAGSTPPAAGTKAAGAGKSAAAAKSASTPKAGAPAKQATSGTGRTRTTPTREERLAAAEAARRRQQIRNRALLAGGVALMVFVVGFVIISDRRERSQQAAEFTTASCRFDRSSDPDDGQGRNHTSAPSYKVNPPSGGNHTPQAAPAGIYTESNQPSDGQIVHAMEHGYVVFWHRPDLDEQSLTTLRGVAQKHAKDILMVPRPSLGVPVAATVWHARVLCGALEVDTLEKFINTFVNKGPEKVTH